MKIKSFSAALFAGLMLVLPHAVSAYDSDIYKEGGAVSYSCDGGENGISLSTSYAIEDIDGKACIKSNYVICTVDNTMLEPAPLYRIEVEYYDGGYENNHYNGKMAAYYAADAEAYSNDRMYPFIGAQDVADSTETGWKTAWLELPVSDFKTWSIGGVEGTFRFGNSAARLPDFALASVRVIPIVEKVSAVTVSEPRYTLAADDGETEIAQPEDGFVNTEVTVSGLGKLNSERVFLVVYAINRATGKIEAAANDYASVDGRAKLTLKCGAQLDAAACDYRYYVWDDGFHSLINSAPAAVGNFRVDSRVTGARLTFDKAQDDFDAVEEYVIIRDGEEYARTKSTVYTDTAPGESHSYSVVACDHMGLTSEPSEQYTSQPVSMLYCDLTAGTQSEIEAKSSGVSMRWNEDKNGNDGYSELAEKDGVSCRAAVDRSDVGKSRSYLYFMADEEKVSQTDSGIRIEITYFDEGTGNILMHYNAIPEEGKPASSSNISKETVVANRTNTMTWKTATVILGDAQFRKAVNGYDFRIMGVTSAPNIYISRVALIQSDKY